MRSAQFVQTSCANGPVPLPCSCLSVSSGQTACLSISPAHVNVTGTVTAATATATAAAAAAAAAHLNSSSRTNLEQLVVVRCMRCSNNQRDLFVCCLYLSISEQRHRDKASLSAAVGVC